MPVLMFRQHAWLEIELHDTRAALANGLPRLAHYKLTEQEEDAVGTLCGGEVRVFIQPFQPPPQLIIVGGGHIGQPLKIMGEAAGFDVLVVAWSPAAQTFLALNR